MKAQSFLIMLKKLKRNALRPIVVTEGLQEYRGLNTQSQSFLEFRIRDWIKYIKLMILIV